MIVFKNKKSAYRELKRKEQLYNRDYYILKTDKHYIVASERLLNKNGYHKTKNGV